MMMIAMSRIRALNKVDRGGLGFRVFGILATNLRRDTSLIVLKSRQKAKGEGLSLVRRLKLPTS
jgi:hypothetical protein